MDNLLHPPIALPLPAGPRGQGGGTLKSHPRDFIVTEIPSYLPSGEGDFHYLWVEKEDIAGPVLLNEVAKRLAIPRADIGCAGMKDRRAITRQWLSVPAKVPVSAALVDGPLGESGMIRLLDVQRHPNKLRTGHLRGNRFEVRLRDRAPEHDLDLEQGLETLNHQGFVNCYGPQRFTNTKTISLGLHLLQGGRVKDRRRRRLAISALQSALFNHWASRRVSQELVNRSLVGDVLRKRESRGLFVSEDADTDSDRLLSGELVVTGPIQGGRMRTAEQDAARLEAELLSEFGLAAADFEALGRKLAPGTRRDLLAYPEAVGITRDEEGVVLSFELPSGCYGSVLLSLLCGPDLRLA